MIILKIFFKIKLIDFIVLYKFIFMLNFIIFIFFYLIFFLCPYFFFPNKSINLIAVLSSTKSIKILFFFFS